MTSFDLFNDWRKFPRSSTWGYFYLLLSMTFLRVKQTWSVWKRRRALWIRCVLHLGHGINRELAAVPLFLDGAHVVNGNDDAFLVTVLEAAAEVVDPCQVVLLALTYVVILVQPLRQLLRHLPVPEIQSCALLN